VSERRALPPDDPGARPANAGEQAARDAVRALASPRAGQGFRSRLRHEFTTGRFGRHVPGPVPFALWSTRPRVLVPLAAGLLLVAGVTLNRGPDWRLVAAAGDGSVTVNGMRFAPDDPALASRLGRGGHVRIEGGVTLDVVAPGVAAVTLAPGAELKLSSAPGRWWSRGMRADVVVGDAYFTTGRAFHGAHLDVSTAEVNVRAVGTAFAVLCEPGGTCVCVMEGRVRVDEAGAAHATAVEVPEGMRRIVHDGGHGETLPILDDSVARLRRQREVSAPLLGR